MLMGGVDTPRKYLPIKLAKVESDEAGKYDDPIDPTGVGVKTPIITLLTRLHTWTLQHVTKGTAGEVARNAALAAPVRPPSAVASLEFCQ